MHRNAESSGTTTNDMSTSMSGGGFSTTGIFEIVATTIDMDTRHDYNENEFVRPYYDPSVKGTVKKMIRRIDEDPPIY
ncbi:hypothetical protein TKK_0001083 [Trichogramma kaykai]